MVTELDNGGEQPVSVRPSPDSLDSSASGDVEDQEEEDPNLGRVLAGRYRIDEFLAGGGMGRVYRATQIHLERVVAIKVLHARLVRQGDAVFTRRFTLEASTSAKLAHPNIITVHDYGEHEGQLFMAMEHLDGEPLSSMVLRLGPLPSMRALNIALQVASGLRAAHAEGVIHRDLKPENIMVLNKKDEDGRDVVKILDFGLVKLFQSDAQPAGGRQGLELTGTGSILGSPRYMAPEQINNEPVDPRTDVYALGGIMYFMLAGHAAFESDHLIEILHKHLFTVPDPIPRCPPQLAAVVFRCLEKSAGQRYPSMAELIRDLKSAGKIITGETVDSGSLPAATAWLAQEARAPHAPSAAPFVSDVDTFRETMEVKSTGELSLVPERRRPRMVLFVGLGAVAVSLVVGLGVWVLRSPAPAPSAVAPSLEPAPTPAPKAPVVRIVSTPDGARVSEGGRALGVTPLSITFDPNDRNVREFQLDLPGYAPSIIRQGPTDTNVLASATLEKLSLEPVEREAERPKPRATRAPARAEGRQSKTHVEAPPPDIRLAR